MTLFIVGVIGFLVGLASHDLAVDGLTDDRRLRPLAGSCPRCGHRRGWLHIRCPNCDRYVEREPVAALVGAGVAMGFYNTFGFDVVLIAYLGFLGLTMALLVTDLEEFRIVDRLNIRGSLVLAVVLLVAALAGSHGEAIVRGLLGSGAYFAGATLIWLAAGGRGFGAGDVKLAPILGLYTAFVSWGTLGQAVFATAMIGGVIAIGLMVVGRAGLKTELPYGPPMIIGAWLAIVLAGIGSSPIPA